MYGKIANDDTALPADCERAQSPWDRGPQAGWATIPASVAAKINKIKTEAHAKQGGPASVGYGLGAEGYAQAGRPIATFVDGTTMAHIRLTILKLARDDFAGEGVSRIVERAKAYEDYVLGSNGAQRDKALAEIAEVARRAGA